MALLAKRSLVTRLAPGAQSGSLAEERQRTLMSLRDHATDVMTRAGLAPDPWQQQVLTSTMAQMLLLCTRQAGKSTVAAALAVRAALLQAGALVLVLSPSLRQSGELFRKVLGHFNALGHPVPVTGESALRVEFANGSRVVSLPRPAMTPTVPVNDPPRVFRPLDPPFPTPSGRPSWSGLLQLNLVGIPLKAYPAVRQREAPAFHQLHAGCGQRIRCPKHCPVHGPVDSAALVRAYEYGPGQHVILEADEVDQLRPAQDRALRLEHFLSPADCDPLFYAGRSLYLLPDGPAAVHGYLVLHAVLVQRDRWALGRSCWEANGKSRWCGRRRTSSSCTCCITPNWCVPARRPASPPVPRRHKNCSWPGNWSMPPAGRRARRRIGTRRRRSCAPWSRPSCKARAWKHPPPRPNSFPSWKPCNRAWPR